MKVLKIIFKPLEPYFFGNERSLAYKGVDKKLQYKASGYFAKSERTPLQSTIFGALRYLGIVEKHEDFSLSKEDIANIGNASFQLRKTNQKFGKIRKISNLYLTDQKGDLYIRIPKDQPNFGDEERTYKGVETFTGTPIYTQYGVKYLPKVDLKKGFFEGYLRVKDGVCVSDDEIFQSVVRVGIDVNQKKDAFFKKEYCFMKDYQFLVYAEVEDDFPQIKERFVKLGQGKTAFAIQVEEMLGMDYEQQELNGLEISTPFPVDAKKVVLLSDSYVKNVEELYSSCYFVHSDTREYRAMETVYNAKNQRQRYKKQEVLLKLLTAGTVFWVRPEQMEKFEKLLSDKDAQIAGFNLYITGGNKAWKM